MKWISVKERLPEKEKAVLVWAHTYGGYATAKMAFYMNSNWFLADEWVLRYVPNVTHWAEIEPPKEES